jgi:hypothetical protein
VGSLGVVVVDLVANELLLAEDLTDLEETVQLDGLRGQDAECSERLVKWGRKGRGMVERFRDGGRGGNGERKRGRGEGGEEGHERKTRNASEKRGKRRARPISMISLTGFICERSRCAARSTKGLPVLVALFTSTGPCTFQTAGLFLYISPTNTCSRGFL